MFTVLNLFQGAKYNNHNASRSSKCCIKEKKKKKSVKEEDNTVLYCTGRRRRGADEEPVAVSPLSFWISALIFEHIFRYIDADIQTTIYVASRIGCPKKKKRGRRKILVTHCGQRCEN